MTGTLARSCSELTQIINTTTMSKPPEWKNSDAKRELAMMINDKTSNIHSTMTFDELYQSNDKFRVYKRDNFRRNANRLYEKITGRKKTWPAAKKERKSAVVNVKSTKVKAKKVQPWKTSLAKAFLMKLLTDDDGPIKGMSPREVYESHEVFQQYKYERFKDNMQRLVAKAQLEKEWAKIEEKDLAQDLEVKPRSQVTTRGYPFWHTHKAKKLLAADVKSGT